jgi:hypothetical protein
LAPSSNTYTAFSEKLAQDVVTTFSRKWPREAAPRKLLAMQALERLLRPFDSGLAVFVLLRRR